MKEFIHRHHVFDCVFCWDYTFLTPHRHSYNGGHPFYILMPNLMGKERGDEGGEGASLDLVGLGVR